MFESFDFSQLLILILVGLLFFKENLIPWLGERLFGIKNGNGKNGVPQWADTLIQYMNHDTTDHHKATHEKLDNLSKIAEDTHQTLKEIKEYGVKCRDK